VYDEGEGVGRKKADVVMEREGGARETGEAEIGNGFDFFVWDKTPKSRTEIPPRTSETFPVSLQHTGCATEPICVFAASVRHHAIRLCLSLFFFTRFHQSASPSSEKTLEM